MVQKYTGPILVGISVCVVALHAVPVIYMMIHQDPLLFVNAWDEETYLTLPAAQEIGNVFGYYISWFTDFVMRNNWLTGSQINAVSDLVILPATLLLTASAASRILNAPFAAGLGYAVVIYFSCLFLNYANPLVAELFPSRTYYPIAFGWEDYAAIVRTPQPQWSYFLLAGAANVALLLKRGLLGILLMLPTLPLLYAFPALALIFLTCLIVAETMSRFIAVIARLHIWQRAALFSFVAWLGMGVCLRLLRPFADQSRALSETHAPIVTIHAVLAIALVLLMSAKLNDRIRQQQSGIQFLWYALPCAMLALTNYQIISGYDVFMKNNIDYAIAPLFGIFLVVSIELLRRTATHLFPVSIVSLCLATMAMTMQANNFNPLTLSWKSFVDSSVSARDIARIKANPCRYVVPEFNLAAKLSYGLNLRTHLPFAYQTWHPLPGGDALFADLMFEAVAPELDPVALAYLERSKENIGKLAETRSSPPSPNARHCVESDFAGPSATVVDISKTAHWVHFSILDIFR